MNCRVNMWCHCVNSEELARFSWTLEVCNLGEKHIPLPFPCHSAVTKCCSRIYLSVVWRPDFSKLSHMHSLVGRGPSDFVILVLIWFGFWDLSPGCSFIPILLPFPKCCFLYLAGCVSISFNSKWVYRSFPVCLVCFLAKPAWEECSSAVQVFAALSAVSSGLGGSAPCTWMWPSMRVREWVRSSHENKDFHYFCTWLIFRLLLWVNYYLRRRIVKTWKSVFENDNLSFITEPAETTTAK